MASRSIEVDADQLDALCRRYGVAALFLFGSVARGDDQPGSDLDLLYDTVPGARLGWEIDDFADELAALFGRPADLVSTPPSRRGSWWSRHRSGISTATGSGVTPDS